MEIGLIVLPEIGNTWLDIPLEEKVLTMIGIQNMSSKYLLNLQSHLVYKVGSGGYLTKTLSVAIAFVHACCCHYLPLLLLLVHHLDHRMLSEVGFQSHLGVGNYVCSSAGDVHRVKYFEDSKFFIKWDGHWDLFLDEDLVAANAAIDNKN